MDSIETYRLFIGDLRAQDTPRSNSDNEAVTMKLLHIDSSVLGPYSASRALSAEIVARQVALHPGIQVVRRDVAADAALHLSPAHLAAWQGGAVADELLGADLAKGGAYLEELV